MAAAAFRLSLLRPSSPHHIPFSSSRLYNNSLTPSSVSPSFLKPSFRLTLTRAASSALPELSSGGDFPPSPPKIPPFSGGGGKGDDGNEEKDEEDHSEGNDDGPMDPISAFLNGWRSRVAADPQFPFKVLMEEIVGVTSCVLGDMASRPNFGLNELDFVFSTLVVGSILNFVLMYLLAPTASSLPVSLPGIFSSSPASHMFEPGSFSVPARFGTFLYKGVTFAGVGFFAGLAGTAISNGLIKLRKKMDPNFETPNKAPPTLLNAFTWALHMGISSNFRYQTLNGVEYVLAKAVPAPVFKGSVVVLRCLNNVLGGMSFVVLARLTGSQKVEGKSEKERLVGTVPVVLVSHDDEKSK